MTPKIPPTFDGQSSWFEFEDLIDDWVGIATLSQEKLGPSLKNSLVGAAEYYGDSCNCSGPGDDKQENSSNGLLDLR